MMFVLTALYTDYVPNTDFQFTLGWLFVFALGVLFFTNLIFAIREITADLKLRAKKAKILRAEKRRKKLIAIEKERMRLLGIQREIDRAFLSDNLDPRKYVHGFEILHLDPNRKLEVVEEEKWEESFES